MYAAACVRASVLVFAMNVAACGGASRSSAPVADDRDHLYVELSHRGARGGALRAGAAAGLDTISFARAVERRGDVALQLETARLDVVGHETRCTVKIFVFRLPQRDLLGIADGSARAGGTDGQARDDCLAGVSTSLVRGRVRPLLQRQLRAKR